jgi:hypothetical protein
MDRSQIMDVYLEIGKKRTFAGAIQWPGWCRSGRDEEAALHALCVYGPRYAAILRSTQLEFLPPADTSAFTVVERLAGNATTDFGAPGKTPASDRLPVGDGELSRFQELLIAGWQAFDASLHLAAGKELRKGPRGGGRNVEEIAWHVLGADLAYLGSLGYKLEKQVEGQPGDEIGLTRQAILRALAAAAGGETLAQGPRGGIRWTPRYFVRRVAWHVIDHAWEIEDRILSQAG